MVQAAAVKALRPLLAPFVALGDVFREPNLRRLELAWVGADLGGWAWTVALSVYAYQHDGLRGLALVGFLRMLANAIPAPFAGLVADRYPRRLVMVASDLSRFVLLLGSAAAAWAGAPVAVYALTLLFSVAMAFFRPAQAALLPSLASAPEQLTAANAAASTIESVSLFAGPALGGLLLSVSSPATVFAVTSGAFLWSALLVLSIRVHEERSPSDAGTGRLAEFFAGFATIGRDGRLRLLIGLFAAQTFVAGALMVLIVVVALDLLGAGETGVGYLNSAIGAGGLAGGAIALAASARRLAVPFAIGILLWGIPIVLVGVFANTAAAIVLLVVVGIGNSLVDVAAFTLLQRAVPDEVLGRVFGVLEGLALTAVAVGSLVAGPLAEAIGIRWTLVAFGALLPVLAALVWPRLLAIDAAAEPPPADEVELLRSLPIFAPLSPPVLEEVASHAEHVDVAAGETVIHQGDPGNRFYVVAAGEPRWPWTAEKASRSGRASTSAKSPYCTTCRGRPRSPRAPTPVCTRSTGTSSSLR